MGNIDWHSIDAPIWAMGLFVWGVIGLVIGIIVLSIIWSWFWDRCSDALALANRRRQSRIAAKAAKPKDPHHDK
jgi:hypothetical protein